MAGDNSMGFTAVTAAVATTTAAGAATSELTTAREELVGLSLVLVVAVGEFGALGHLGKSAGAQVGVLSSDGDEDIEELARRVSDIHDLVVTSPPHGRALLEDTDRVLVTAYKVLAVGFHPARLEGREKNLLTSSALLGHLADVAKDVVRGFRRDGRAFALGQGGGHDEGGEESEGDGDGFHVGKERVDG